MEDKTEAGKKEKRKRRIRAAQHILTALLLLCLSYLIWYRWDAQRARQKNDRLRAIAGQSVLYAGEKAQAAGPVQGGAPQEPDTGGAIHAGDDAQGGAARDDAADAEPESAGGAGETLSADGYAQLLAVNPDLKGWLSIPDTALSYPVVQGQDNSYYLRRDFYGEADRRGTLFVDCAADFDASAPHLIIYGHNMKDGSMFACLQRYREESYWSKHPSFFLTRPDGEWEYRIVAVLANDLFSRADEPFQFYDYNVLDTKEKYEAYYQGIKSRSFYDTGVEAAYPEELVTLCTCDYTGRDARLLVVGKRMP